MENILKRSAPVYFEKPDGCPIEWYHCEFRLPLYYITTPFITLNCSVIMLDRRRRVKVKQCRPPSVVCERKKINVALHVFFRRTRRHHRCRDYSRRQFRRPSVQVRRCQFPRGPTTDHWYAVGHGSVHDDVFL